MADETTTTSWAEQIPADILQDTILGLNRPRPIGRQIAWIVPGKLTVPTRFASFETMTDPATKTQGTADFARQAITLAETSATPALLGLEIAPTDEALNAALPGLLPQTLAEILREMDQKLDADILAVSTSATTTVGAVTDVMDMDKYMAGVLTWKSLDVNAPNGVVCVMDSGAATRLIKDRLQATAGSTVMESFGRGPVSDNYCGNLAGIDVWSSNNVATESTGFSNFFTAVGNGYSGLGLVMAKDVTVEFNRSAEGARGAKSFYVFSMGYGVTMTRSDLIVELLST